jgi:hypothetical protein
MGHYMNYILLTCNETNLMHYLASVCSVTIPLHVLGLLVANHQEVAMYICDSWYVLYVSVDCRQAWMEWNSTIYLQFIQSLYLCMCRAC